ncbi:hypothetical protein [Bradyrhizobium sp. Cp5.3]|uniref:hypothetical protein n=1 Tax=Bradyrhizobium sp. Cp5.3 TaxID=443598 RepID=UPI0012ECA455|nr:hypothetical protein [Bradyrhizobium sp. Cp5.3]
MIIEADMQDIQHATHTLLSPRLLIDALTLRPGRLDHNLSAKEADDGTSVAVDHDRKFSIHEL